MLVSWFVSGERSIDNHNDESLYSVLSSSSSSSIYISHISWIFYCRDCRVVIGHFLLESVIAAGFVLWLLFTYGVHMYVLLRT